MAWTAPRTWSNGEIVTQTMLNTDVRDNMRELWHEIAYVEFTADVSVTTASTEGSPLDIVSSGALTYVANPIIIEFYCMNWQSGNPCGINLWDASTDLGRLENSASHVGSVFAARRLTPSAASHTYKVRAYTTVATATMHAGAGGVATDLPGYIRVLQRGS